MKKIDRSIVLVILLAIITLVLVYFFQSDFLVQGLIVLVFAIVGGFIYLSCKNDEKYKEDK